MKYTYFVAYSFVEDKTVYNGNTTIDTNFLVQSNSQLRDLERLTIENCRAQGYDNKGMVIINFLLLNREDII